MEQFQRGPIIITTKRTEVHWLGNPVQPLLLVLVTGDTLHSIYSKSSPV